MRFIATFLAFALAAFFAGSPLAATVTSQEGQVLINRGDGYRLVTQPMQAEPGHLVIANPSSAGRVVYPDGCAVDVRPGVVFTVAQKSPCETRGAHVETDGSLKDIPKPEEERGERSLTPWIIAGGAAVAVGVVLLLNGKDHAASP